MVPCSMFHLSPPPSSCPFADCKAGFIGDKSSLHEIPVPFFFFASLRGGVGGSQRDLGTSKASFFQVSQNVGGGEVALWKNPEGEESVNRVGILEYFHLCWKIQS